MPPLPLGVVMPEDVDLLANIREAQRHRLNKNWFISKVGYGKPWDYKTRGIQYENFGNFHFGIVGRAAWFPESILLREAGRAQRENPNSPQFPGDPGGMGFERYDPSYATGEYPYGDDPMDQYYIRRGFAYFYKLLEKGMVKNL
jgi:hypothetical protein